MTRDSLKPFLEQVQEAFLSDDLFALGQFFAWPLVVYSLAGVTVIRDEREFRQMVGQYRAALMALSVAQSDTSIISREPQQNHRTRATVRVNHFDEAGQWLTRSLIRYFLVWRADTYEIEMIEYLEAPISPEDVERIVH